ncbi:MAG: hypothetical protein PHI35_04385 [Victivallaceae bacterium]|nr:hypothetical protein [Victivallaceae bacterium]
MSTNYDDIINLPHHVSCDRRHMSMRDRAAQFSPFAALVGYEAVIEETGRSTNRRREPDAQELAELNRRIGFLATKLADNPAVEIEHFVCDDRKAGGAYRVTAGSVRTISAAARTVTMCDGEVIRMENITGISGGIFDENFGD